VFSSKNAPTSDVRERLAEAVMKDTRVRGVGWQTITFGEKRQVAIVVMVQKRFGKVVIANALKECGLENKVEGFGSLKFTGTTCTRLERIKRDISTIKPGPTKAAKPDHDNSSTSEDDEPRKRKAPAHKRQRRPQRAKKQGGRTAAAAAADSDSGGESDRGKQIRIAGTAAAAAAAPAPQRTEDVAALQQEVTAATQRAHDLSSAVCELLLDLGEAIGSGTTLPDEVGLHLR
jgi:hypothetical protein